MSFVGLPNEGSCDFAKVSGRDEGRFVRDGRPVLLAFFISASAAGFGSAYWEMSSLMLSSCSEVAVAGGCSLAACPNIPTGGVAERASLSFSSCAFNSAALVLILIFVMGRESVGVLAVGKLLECGGENYADDFHLARYIWLKMHSLHVAQILGRQQAKRTGRSYLGVCCRGELIIEGSLIVESDLGLEVTVHKALSIANLEWHHIRLERELGEVRLPWMISER